MYQAQYTKETRTACVYCPVWRDCYTTVIPALESNDSDRWVFFNGALSAVSFGVERRGNYGR